jgi:hypothetical protein
MSICLFQIVLFFAMFVMAAVSALEAKKENLQGSEAVYYGSPYGAYGAYGSYPYTSFAGYPSAASAYPSVSAGYHAAFPFYH